VSCAGKELFDEISGHKWVEKRLYLLASDEYQDYNDLPRDGHQNWTPVRYCERCGLLQVSFEERQSL
jgi:hypothetical protein